MITAGQRPPRVLGVFAHPDDETLCVGGTLAKYAGTGADVRVVCLTKGGACQIQDASAATRATLTAARVRELRAAGKHLGRAQSAIAVSGPHYVPGSAVRSSQWSSRFRLSRFWSNGNKPFDIIVPARPLVPHSGHSVKEAFPSRPVGQVACLAPVIAMRNTGARLVAVWPLARAGCS